MQNEIISVAFSNREVIHKKTSKPVPLVQEFTNKRELITCDECGHIFYKRELLYHRDRRYKNVEEITHSPTKIFIPKFG